MTNKQESVPEHWPARVDSSRGDSPECPRLEAWEDVVQLLQAIADVIMSLPEAVPPDTCPPQFRAELESAFVGIDGARLIAMQRVDRQLRGAWSHTGC